MDRSRNLPLLWSYRLCPQDMQTQEASRLPYFHSLCSKFKSMSRVFQPLEKQLSRYYSRLRPSLTEIVTGSPKDFDDPIEPVGLNLKRTTEENGVPCYWFFKGVGEKQVETPSRELNQSLAAR